MTSRLSALDASFLTAETPTAHMHVGWAAVFEPPKDGPRPSFRDLRDHIESRLDRAPRYRQRLYSVPFGLHDPIWVDDERFDVSRHVQRARSRDLDEIVGTVMSTPLERSRPMWEMWIADRLDDGRIAVVGKVHHCMVDGLAAVELASLLLDPTPDAEVQSSEEWRPQPGPGMLTMLADAAADRAREAVSLARVPIRMLRSPARVSEAAEDVRRAARALNNSLNPPAPASQTFNPRISPLRRLVRIDRPLDQLQGIKAHFRVKLNDVVLAACAGGVREFLISRGEEPVRLKTMVPVALRGRDEAGALGNEISFIFVELPVDQPHPAERLHEVHAITRARKESGEPSGAAAILDAMRFTPPPVQRALTRLVSSPRTFNLVISNIPGPPERTWMRGCELRGAYPVVPSAEHHALSIGITTLRDRACFGLYSDGKMLPDADLLAEFIGSALDELAVLAGLTVEDEEEQREPDVDLGPGLQTERRSDAEVLVGAVGHTGHDGFSYLG